MITTTELKVDDISWRGREFVRLERGPSQTNFDGDVDSTSERGKDSESSGKCCELHVGKRIEESLDWFGFKSEEEKEELWASSVSRYNEDKPGDERTLLAGFEK